MYIPSPLPRVVGVLDLHQKRQTDLSPSSDSLIPYVDNKVGLVVGVGLALAAILALLLGGVIKHFRLRRSRSTSEPSPTETQSAARQPSFSQPHRLSNAGSDITEATLCCDSPVDSEKKQLNHHIPPPPSVLTKSQALVPPFGSRPPSTLSVATTISRHTVKTERSSSWASIAQRVDENAGTTESKRMSTTPSLSSVPPSPRTPTSPSTPIRIPSRASLKDGTRHIYGSN